jgi:putative hydrolase of the HAD superfamily
MIRAVVFDYFGTLTPTILTMVTAEEQAGVGQALGVDPSALEQLWRASFADRATGRTGGPRATLRMLATRLADEPGKAGLDTAVRLRGAAFLRSAQPRPEAVDVLARLRADGLRLAVVSDCSLELVEIWPQLPLADAVDATVFSALVGRRKPDPLLYRLACERLDVAPEECLYVGDGGSGELTGAAAMGMRPVLLADETWHTGHRYDQDDWQGEVVHRLDDVPALLGVQTSSVTVQTSSVTVLTEGAAR